MKTIIDFINEAMQVLDEATRTRYKDYWNAIVDAYEDQEDEDDDYWISFRKKMNKILSGKSAKFNTDDVETWKIAKDAFESEHDFDEEDDDMPKFVEYIDNLTNDAKQTMTAIKEVKTKLAELPKDVLKSAWQTFENVSKILYSKKKERSGDLVGDAAFASEMFYCQGKNANLDIKKNITKQLISGFKTAKVEITDEAQQVIDILDMLPGKK